MKRFLNLSRKDPPPDFFLKVFIFYIFSILIYYAPAFSLRKKKMEKIEILHKRALKKSLLVKKFRQLENICQAIGWPN